VTTEIDTVSLIPEPEIRFEREHNVARKDVLKKFGTTKEWMGAGSIRIILNGRLSGTNCYTNRDSLLTLFATKNTTVNFYSDTIGFGSSGSPKIVWLINCVFIHPRGAKNIVDYTITLEVND